MHAGRYTISPYTKTQKPPIKLDKLISWTDSTEDGVKYFNGSFGAKNYTSGFLKFDYNAIPDLMTWHLYDSTGQVFQRGIGGSVSSGTLDGRGRSWSKVSTLSGV